MPDTLSDLSNSLALAVERGALSVVTIHGRPRIPSSGIVWRSGLILTSDAALRRDEDLRVTLPDGKTVPAALKGRDATTDLALLSCDTGSTAAASFGKGALKPGQIILTVGRTADTGPIATMGIISGVSGEWQTWRGGKLDQFVRLDVSVYPTSAGGAVINGEGKILGVVAAGLSRSSVIAITQPTIERVAEVLSTKGRVARGYLGIGVQSVAIPQALKEQLSIQQDTGVIALNVEDGGPAAGAGMLIGDVVLSLGNHRITGPEALHAALDSSAVNKQLPLNILRGGTLLKLVATVAERAGRGA
ncbi:MAG: S1C family serine protease [Bryobacteraceae bacterium]